MLHVACCGEFLHVDVAGSCCMLMLQGVHTC